MLILPKIGPKSLKNVQKNHENHENCRKNRAEKNRETERIGFKTQH